MNVIPSLPMVRILLPLMLFHLLWVRFFVSHVCIVSKPCSYFYINPILQQFVYFLSICTEALSTLMSSSVSGLRLARVLMILGILLYVVVIFLLFFICVKRDLKVQRLLCGATLLLGLHFSCFTSFSVAFTGVIELCSSGLFFSFHQSAHCIPRFD